MYFKKYTALGNVYIVIDPLKNKVKLTEENIKLICNHYKGLGSDGIMYGPFFDKNNKISCKILNPDGSEAEKSGNGTRIFAQYLLDENYVNSNSIEVDTKGGLVKMKVLDFQKNIIESEIGIANFDINKIGIVDENCKSNDYLEKDLEILDKTFKVNCVDVGNPHCVIILNEISANLAKKYGPEIENHKIFKNRINVQFVKILDKKTAQIEIWERGAGYTMSSGTSSAAVCAVLNKLKLTENEILLKMPGGEIKVSISNENIIKIIGSVDRVAKGELLLKELE